MQTPGATLLPNRKSQQEQYFFSPAFQCYTSPPFYKNLLNDLQYISSCIDKCSETSRAIVWEQLFILLGAKPATCSKVFGPVLQSWAEAPTINLLAVELLYLAFAISIDKHPDLLNNGSTQTKHPGTSKGPIMQNSYGAYRPDMHYRNQQSPNDQQRSQRVSSPHQRPNVSPINQQPQPQSQPKPQPQSKPQHQPQHQSQHQHHSLQNSHTQKIHNESSHVQSINSINRFQQPQQHQQHQQQHQQYPQHQQQSPQHIHHNGERSHHPPISRASQQHHFQIEKRKVSPPENDDRFKTKEQPVVKDRRSSAPPVTSVASNSPKKSFDFEKLLQLQSWKSSLDSQPLEIREKIWRVWESLTGKSHSAYENMSISKTVNYWAKDIATHSDTILSFHSAVECIKTNFSLNLDKPATHSPPISTSRPISSPQNSMHSSNAHPPPNLSLAPINSLNQRHARMDNTVGSHINLSPVYSPHPPANQWMHHNMDMQQNTFMQRGLRPMQMNKRPLPPLHQDPKRTKNL